jgi:AAA domain
MSRHAFVDGGDGFCLTCERVAADPAAGHVTPNGHNAVAPRLAAVPEGRGRRGGNGDSSTPAPAGRQVVVTLASSIRPRPVRWLWPDRIPSGALTLLAGREGIGKSLVGVHLAAQLTRGTLPGGRHGQPSRVMFATSEDAWEFTMVPRLLAAGADLGLIGRVQVEDTGIVTGLTLPVDAAELGGYMASHDVALLVLDPLTSVMDGRIDAHRDREVRTALEPLGQLAEKAGGAVLGLVHLGKSMGSDPVNLILGSRAFSAVARVALVAFRDPDDEATNVLSVEKSNLGRIDVPALTYRIDGAQIMTDEGRRAPECSCGPARPTGASATSWPTATASGPSATRPRNGSPATSPAKTARQRRRTYSRPRTLRASLSGHSSAPEPAQESRPSAADSGRALSGCSIHLGHVRANQARTQTLARMTRMVARMARTRRDRPRAGYTPPSSSADSP